MNKTFFENKYLILSNIWKNRYLLVLSPIIFSICFFIFHSMIPEKYQVNLDLLIQDTEELNPQLSDLSISSIQRKTVFYESLIKSEKVLDKAINASDTNLIKFQDLKELKDRIRSGLKLSQTSYSKNDRNVFKIVFKWNNKNEIYPLFLSINDSFIDAFNSSHINSINKSKNFINAQLKRKKEEILKCEKDIIDFKLLNKDVLTELSAFDYKEGNTLDQKIIEKEILFMGINEKYELLQNQIMRDNPIKKMLKLKISAKKELLSNYRLIYTENHSLIKKEKQALLLLEKELSLFNKESILDLNKLKETLLNKTDTIPYFMIEKVNQLENFQIEKNKIERELLGLKKLKEKQQENLEKFGDLYIQLKDLEQDLKIKEEKYNKLLEKEEYIKITAELKNFEREETIQIMNKDSLEIKHLKQPKIIYIVGGFIFGIFLILSMSILEFLLNQNVIKQREFEDILKSKVISRVPHIREKNRGCK